MAKNIRLKSDKKHPIEYLELKEKPWFRKYARTVIR